MGDASLTLATGTAYPTYSSDLFCNLYFKAAEVAKAENVS